MAFYLNQTGIRFRSSLLLLLSALNLVIIGSVILAILAFASPSIRFLLLGLTGWAFIMALLFIKGAWNLSRALSIPLDQLSKVADSIGNGDLDVNIPYTNRKDELGKLAASINQMRMDLADRLEEIRRQNQRIRLVFDTMSEGVILVDHMNRLLTWNRYAANFLGWNKEGTLNPGMNITDLGFPELSSMPAEPERPFEIRLSPRNNQAKPPIIRILRSPLKDGQDRTTGYVAVIRDITQEKEIEQLKNDFFSMVTHELKTPLTVIEGYLKLLLNERSGPLTDKQQEGVELSLKQSETLKRMIQDLLDVSRMAAGRFSINKENCSLSEVLNEVVSRFQPEAKEKNITLSIEPIGQGAESARLEIDRSRIDQVMTNLINNALKFTSSGGKIRVTWTAGDESAMITTSDTGAGIPQDKLEKVFDKFYQVDTGDTRKTGGSGLGLFICRQIIEAHGGSITASSEATGSSFTIILPMPGRGINDAAPSSGDHTSKKEKV